MPRTPFETLWTGLRHDHAAGVPLESTITVRVPSERGVPSSTVPLPHISLGRRASKSAPPPATGPLSEFEVTGLLGQGGMGSVHLARQRSLGRDVAIKVLKTPVEDPSARYALLQEARFMGLLEHPGIIPVHALGCDDAGEPVLVMKRVEGVSWDTLLRDPKHAAWESIDAPDGERLLAHVQILMQVCNAVHFAHRRGVVHRDIKPANVMVGGFGDVYLVDFGIAMMPTAREPSPTAANADEPSEPLIGTPVYMAPEMAESRADLIDARTDVYLLGATLHHVLTGKPRHRGGDLFIVLKAAYDSVPFDYPSSVPSELASICNKATSRERDDRYPTALALRQALRGFLHHRSSFALSDAAMARLVELENGVGDPAAPSRHHLTALATECRFGFMQAKREWSDNPVAAAGLRRCLVAMIKLEIARGNAPAARGLYVELGENVAGLEERIARLEADAGDRAARDAELARMKKDADFTVTGRARAALLALATVITTSASLAVTRGRVSDMTRGELTASMALGTVVLCVLAFLLRKRVFDTVTSRRILAGFGGTTVISLANRALGMALELPIRAILLCDLFVMLAGIGALGVAIEARFLWGVPIPILAILAVAADDTLMPAAMTFSTMGLLFVVGYIGWGAPKKAGAGGSASGGR